MPKGPTVQQFFKQFPDDDACLDHLMRTRFGDKLDCPKCGKHGKFHRVKARPVYECQWCGHHLHPMVGTPFEKSRTPLQKWFYAIYLFTTTRSGVSAKELQRQLGVTYKCAWRMGHEIRKYMSAVDGDNELSGEVEVDEVYIGGKRALDQRMSNKTVVLGMLQRDGEVQTQVIPDAKTKTVFPILNEQIAKGSSVYTDQSHTYRNLSAQGYAHEKVDHGRKGWARGKVSTNSLESYWARLQNSIKGTHVHVSAKYMDLYCDEFEYRFNMRKVPHLMFDRLLAAF